MRILDCAANDQIMIGTDYEVEVIEITGRHVRLGCRDRRDPASYFERTIEVVATPQTAALATAPADDLGFSLRR